MACPREGREIIFTESDAWLQHGPLEGRDLDVECAFEDKGLSNCHSRWFSMSQVVAGSLSSET